MVLLQSGLLLAVAFLFVTQTQKCTAQKDDLDQGRQCLHEGKSFPNPGDCSTYFKCQNQVIQLKKCKNGLLFNPSSNLCDWPASAGCKKGDFDKERTEGPTAIKTTSVVITPPVDNRTYLCGCQDCLLPFPPDCSAYIFCINGKGTLKRCTGGLKFNAEKENCDHPENVDCKGMVVEEREETLGCPAMYGLFPHPELCEKFIHCSHNIPHIKDCPSGLHFNPKLKVCDWPYQAGCQTDDKVLSTELPVNENSKECSACDSCTLLDRNDCSVFTICHNGKAYRKTCPHDLLFNADLLECDYPENVVCKTSIDDICPEPSGLYPHEDCTKFIHCAHNVPHVKDCPAGLHFNPKLLACDWPNRAGCTPKEYIIHGLPGEIDPKIQCPCKNCFVNDKTNCSKYYFCDDKTAFKRKCISDLQFNKNLSSCDRPESAGCVVEKPKILKFECPTPDGLHPNPVDCRSYYHCSHGTSYFKQCPHNLHFSKTLKVCDYPQNAGCEVKLANKKSEQNSINIREVNDNESEVSENKEPNEIFPFQNSEIKAKIRESIRRSVASSSNVLNCPCVSCILPDPSDCKKYIECSNLTPLIRQCPPNYVFNSKKLKCERSNGNDCPSNNVVNPQPQPKPKPDGISKNLHCTCSNCNLPHPKECSKYIECVNGSPNERSCPKPFNFNENVGKCQRGYVCPTNVEIPQKPDNEHKPGIIDFKCPCSNCLVPHSTDCTKYIECISSAPYERKCPNGYLFSKEKKKCERDQGQGCQDISLPTPPTEITDPLDTFKCPCQNCKLPDSEGNTKYIECINGKPTKRKCPPNYIFNDKKHVCVRVPGDGDENGGGHVIIPTPNPSRPEGVDLDVCPCTSCILPNPSSCNKYIECFGRLPQQRQCPASYIFNENKRKCIWNNGKGCDTTPISNEKVECPYNSGMFRYPNDCRKIIHCTNGVSTLKECPANLHFSVINQRCVMPSLSDCDGPGDDTVQCPSETGIMKDPSDCASYFECVSGKPVSRACPSGYAFNDAKNKCERSDENKCSRLARDPMCPQENGLFPHPAECQLYVTCNQGRAVISSCSNGQHFNHKIGRCDSPESAGCKSIAEPPTPFRPVITGKDLTCPCPSCILRDPSDCTAYIECYKFKPLRRRCPPNYAFNKDRKVCVRNGVTECLGIVGDGFCPESNGTFPFPQNCQKFIHCSNGIPSLKACAANYHYSKDLRRCELPEVAKCDSEGNNQVKCPCQDCNIPDAADCTSYLECIKGVPHRRACPPKYGFDRNLKRCVHYESGNLCPGLLDQSLCLRPHGMFPHPSDCTKFVYCSNGLPYIKECDDQLHFSDTEQKCMKPEEAGCDRIPNIIQSTS